LALENRDRSHELQRNKTGSYGRKLALQISESIARYVRNLHPADMPRLELFLAPLP